MRLKFNLYYCSIITYKRVSLVTIEDETIVSVYVQLLQLLIKVMLANMSSHIYLSYMYKTLISCFIIYCTADGYMQYDQLTSVYDEVRPPRGYSAWMDCVGQICQVIRSLLRPGSVYMYSDPAGERYRFGTSSYPCSLHACSEQEKNKSPRPIYIYIYSFTSFHIHSIFYPLHRHVSLSSFSLAVPCVRKCSGKYQCMSSAYCVAMHARMLYSRGEIVLVNLGRRFVYQKLTSC